jgi:hypothetical protein
VCTQEIEFFIIKKAARKFEVEMKNQAEKSFVEFENGQGRFEM